MAGKYFTQAIKTTLIVVFAFQLLSTVERQVFDFLGYMWAPIIGNFFQIIAVILGLFGACQHYRSFVIVYAVWSTLWMGWNIFVICLYLEVGILNRNRERYILTIGTESKSWWLEHGIGCMITNNSWLGGPDLSPESSRPIPPEEFVEGCILQYYYVEVIHAAVQVLLALVGLVVAAVVLHAFLDEEDASSPANDELEFMKIRSRAANRSTQRTNTNTTTNNFDNLAFDSDTYNDDSDSLRRAYRLPPPGPRPYEQPPSYDTTMRNNNSTEAETRAANLYYASDRQSIRSKASTRSKRSTTASGYHRGGNQASSRSRRSTRDRSRNQNSGPQDLPWGGISALRQAICAISHQSGLSQQGDSRLMPQSMRTVPMCQRGPEECASADVADLPHPVMAELTVLAAKRLTKCSFRKKALEWRLQTPVFQTMFTSGLSPSKVCLPVPVELSFTELNLAVGVLSVISSLLPPVLHAAAPITSGLVVKEEEEDTQQTGGTVDNSFLLEDS